MNSPLDWIRAAAASRDAAGLTRRLTTTKAGDGLALTELTGAPSALVLSTGYAANLAALTTLADAGTLIVSDEHTHASLIDGCRLSRAAVTVSRHNDLDHVADLLSRRDAPRAVVVPSRTSSPSRTRSGPS